MNFEAKKQQKNFTRKKSWQKRKRKKHQKFAAAAAAPPIGRQKILNVEKIDRRKSGKNSPPIGRGSEFRDISVRQFCKTKKKKFLIF